MPPTTTDDDSYACGSPLSHADDSGRGTAIGKNSAVGEEHKCVTCGETANYQCEQCTKLSGSGTYLCESCWGKAHFLPWLSKHTKTQLSAATTPCPSYVCSTHKKKLRLFCLTDNVFVCTSCAFSLNHKGHNIISLEEHCEKKKNETVEFIKTLRNMGAPLTESLTSIDFVSRSILEVHGRFEESIHKEFSEVISLLQKREEYLILESKTISTQKLEGLAKQRECVNSAMRHIEFYQKKFQLTVEKGNQHQIVERSSKIPAVLKVVSLSKEDLLPNATELVTTSTSDILKVKSAISSLCFISCNPIITSISRVGTEGGTATISGTWCPTATNQDITVVLDQKPCTKINLADPGSTLTCSVPSGVGTNLGVTMTVLGVPTMHEHTPLFSYSGCSPPSFDFESLVSFLKGPQITSVTKVPAGGRITVSGSGFGTTTDHLAVLVNGVSCTDVVMSNPGKVITCVVPMQARDAKGESGLVAWGAGGGGGEHTTGNHGGGGGFATARYAALPGELSESPVVWKHLFDQRVTVDPAEYQIESYKLAYKLTEPAVCSSCGARFQPLLVSKEASCYGHKGYATVDVVGATYLKPVWSCCRQLVLVGSKCTVPSKHVVDSWGKWGKRAASVAGAVALSGVVVVANAVATLHP
ncbi:tripartite motif-containing protein 35 [Pelomyxa schiedti]|nr:tripartite motif-containing protein 35 [Pelomyxa schiedti]